MKVEDILGGKSHRRYRRGPRQNRINGLSLSPIELRASDMHDCDCDCDGECTCPPEAEQEDTL